MLYPEQEYHQFSAMNALIQKTEQSDPAAREHIMSLVIATMHDKSRPVFQRYQCCKVISACGYEQGVPDLIQVLLNDYSGTVRGVAAEALEHFPENEAARDALLQAARQEAGSKAPEVLNRRLGQGLPEAPSARAAVSTVEERAPTGPPQPPPGPAPPVTTPLPWPFPGGQEDQHIFNNYQQPTDGYIHCALDFMHPAGTPVAAVDSGYVAAIYTNYPDWITHHCFIVTPEKGGNEGWCYTHLDPRTFTFGEGDFVRQGERLGTLVDFSVGDRPGNSHLHLSYVRFSRDASRRVNVHSLLDPLYFFDWKDTEPPVFQPLRFVTEDMAEQFPTDAAGIVTVSGRVDVLAAVTDRAYPGHIGNLGVPVVMLSISDGKYTMQKLVLDHREDVGNRRQVKPLYLSYDQKRAFLNPDSFPRYQMLRVTKTDGDGKIAMRDVAECWDTTARDARGRPLWPNRRYSVNVYAWDIAGNRAVAGAVVYVRN
jgi:murein DD-endopeptidase MepM/ murein hydrolase activator NlpD